MRKKIENNILITCSGVDLTTVTNIEFYVSQAAFFGCYEPLVVSPYEMLVRIPFEDACKMRSGEARLQFAYVGADGAPRATDIVTVAVGSLLKEAGYDPI